ncbi:anti-sigma factor [Streptomyces chartreusis]|uniref:anti-sigma factor n=1 Tax=Streptomyces chartreusis TaxID=1969 RepID=UPI0036999BC5
MTTADLHWMTGAYALHALSDDEREAFERHLPACEPCEREATELRATAARLGLAVSMTPRTAMREQVLRRINAVRQETPDAGPAARPERAGARARPISRWVLAACMAAVAALGGTAVWQHERAESALEQARRVEQGAGEIATVLAAPDAAARSAALGDGATGTVVVSQDLDRAVFVVSGMERPTRGKVYQLWFADGTAMRSAGLMDPARGDQTVLLRGPVDGASGMGITVEPAGGSRQPTSPPLALMNLPA